MKILVDIKEMPGYNPEVKNGVTSVSEGNVYLKEWNKKKYPCCKRHGAMLKVSKDGIWRCGESGCDNGGYYYSSYWAKIKHKLLTLGKYL